MKTKHILTILAVIITLAVAPSVWAATVTTAGSGNWNSTTVNAPWPGGTVPAAGSDIIIANGHTVTVTANVAASPATITIDSGGQLTVGGANLTVSGATTVSGTLLHNNSGGTHTYAGDVTINSGGVWNETAAAAISFGGSLQNDGTFTASTGTHTFTGASKTFSGSISIATVKLSGTYQNNGTLTVNSFNTSGGTLTQGANSTLNYSGTLTAFDGTLDATATGNTVNYTLAGAQTLKPTAYHHLTLSGSGAKTMTGVTSIGGDLTVSGSATMTGNAAFAVGGAWNYGSSGSSTLTTSTPISIGTFNQTAGTIVDNGNTITVTGTGANTWTKSGTFTTTGTVKFTGAAPEIGACAFANLNIDVGGANTATLMGAVSVPGTLTLASGALANGANLTLGNGATISRATGTLAAAPTFGTTVNVTYTGSTSTTTSFEIPSSTTVLNALTINNNGGVALGTSPTVNGALTLTSGALSIGANTLTLNSTIATTGGSLTGGSSANILFNGSGATTLPAVSLNNLTVNRSAVAISLGGAVTVDGTLTLTLGALSIGANTLTINGPISTASGTLTGSTSSDIVVGGTGASTTLPAVASGLRNLALNRANGLTLGGAVSIAAAGTLTLTDGQLSNGANLTLASGASISREAGSLAAAPTFNTTVNVTYTGSTPVTTGNEIPTAATILQTLNVNNTGGVTLGANVTSKGIVTIGSGATLNAADKTITLSASGTPLVVSGGTFTPSTSTVIYTSSTGASVTGGINYHNLTVSSSGDTFTVAADMTVENILTVTTGTIFNANGKIITLSGAGTPLAVSGTFTPASSTIAYTSGSGATVAGLVYDNLTINGTGTFSLSGAVTVNSTLALTGGALSIGANTLTLSGAVSGTGTLTGGATSSITVGGSGTSTTLPAVALNNLTVNRANGIALSPTVTVGGTLTLTSGQVTSAGNLILGDGATISRAAGSLDAGVPVFSGVVNVTYTSGGATTGTELPASTSALQALNINNSTGTLTLGANATVNGALSISSGGIFSDGGYTLTAKSTVSNSGTHSSTGNGQILFAGGTAQTVAGTFGNVELNNASGTTSGAATINGNLKVTAGTFTVPNVNLTVNGLTTVDGTLAITSTTGTKTFGGITISSTGTWNNSVNETVSIKGNFQCDGSFTSGTAAYTFDGTSGQNLGGSASPTFALLTLNNTAAPVTASGNFNVSGTFSIAAASVVFSPAADVVINSTTTQGTLSGLGTIQVTRTAATADLFNQYKFTTRTLTSMKVDYAGTGDQTINVPSTSYGALTISGSGTKILEGSMNVVGTLSLTSGELAIGANTLTLNAGITTTGGSLAGGANSSINLATAGGGAVTLPALTLNNLTVNRTAGITLGDAVSVGGTITLTAGAISGAANLTLGEGATISRAAGSLDAAPTFDGAVNLIYTGTVTTGSELPTDPSVLNDLTVSANTTTLGANVQVNGSVNLAGGVLNTSAANNFALAVIGNLAVGNGTLTANASTITVGGNFTGSGTFTAGTCTFIFNGAGAQDIAAGTSFGTFNNLIINKSAGTATLLGAQTVGGTLTLTSGALSIGANTLTLNGGITTTAGTLIGGASSSISFGTAAGPATTLPAVGLNNLTVNRTAGITLGGDVSVAGTLTFTAGKITTVANTLILGSAATVSGAVAGKYVFGNLQKDFTAGAGKSFAFPIGDSTDYEPLAVTSLTVNAGGGSLKASTTPGSHPQLGTAGINSSGEVNQYWTLTPVSGAFGTYGATFTYLAGEAGGTPATYIVKRWDGNAWSSATVSGTPTTTATVVTGVSGFGEFAIGNVGPVANADSFRRQKDISLKMLKSALLANDTGTSVSFTSVNSPSAGGATLTASGSYVFYTPANNNNDTFTYTITDGNGATATGTVTVNVDNPQGGIAQAPVLTNGTAVVRFAGIPNYGYYVQRASAVEGPYTTVLTTNAPANGLFIYVDDPAPSPSAFYRLIAQ